MSITSILRDYDFFAGFALAWGIFEWYSYKPKLRIDLKTDMVVDNRGFAILDQKNEHTQQEKGISIEVVNIGKVPTTLKFLAVQPYKRGIFRKKRHPLSSLLKKFTAESAPMPIVLKPGEIWSGFYADQTHFFNLSEKFTLETEVHHSFSKKPKTVKLKFLEHKIKQKPAMP